MALKYYTGSVKPITAAWKCPTCGAEVVTPLELGCPQCRAGADAKAATEQRAVLTGQAVSPVDAAFLHWYGKTPDQGRDAQQMLRLAFIAGAVWADATNMRAQPPRTPQESTPLGTDVHHGWGLRMLNPDGEDAHDEDVDERTHATLLAALAFYRDNQLAYGALPGQLSAAEVSELITKLSPTEEPPQ